MNKTLILILSALALTACGAQVNTQQTVPTAFPAQAVTTEAFTITGAELAEGTYKIAVSATSAADPWLFLESDQVLGFKELNSNQKCIHQGGSSQKVVLCAYADGIELEVTAPGRLVAYGTDGQQVVTRRYQLK